MPTPHSSSSRSSAQSSLTVLWIVDKNAKKVQYKSGCMITLPECLKKLFLKKSFGDTTASFNKLLFPQPTL